MSPEEKAAYDAYMHGDKDTRSRQGQYGNGQQSAYTKVKNWWGDKNVDTIGANPYQGGWDTLIQQLQQQSNGQGPSLAGDAYKQANAQGMNNILSMSRGGSAGAVRQGQQQMGRMQQGMAFGYANARLQEQLAARAQLQGALGGAGQAWFQPQQANMAATNAAQSNGQKMLNFLQQNVATAAQFAGAGGGGAPK